MTQEEYKRETNQAVELVKAIDNVIGTKYYLGCVQSGSDIDTLINVLMIHKVHIEYVIEHLKHIGEKYKKEKEYNEFVSKCSNHEFENIKWSEIPDMARDELMLMYRGLVCGLNNVTEDDHDYYFRKATKAFKDKYNINKIEI